MFKRSISTVRGISPAVYFCYIRRRENTGSHSFLRESSKAYCEFRGPLKKRIPNTELIYRITHPSIWPILKEPAIRPQEIVFCSLNYHPRSYSDWKENLPSFLVKSSVKVPDSWGSPEAEAMIVHFTENIADKIHDYDSLLVFFYTAWCHHCKLFKPVYGEAAMRMKNEKLSGTLGAIDLTKRMEIADLFNIVAVPLLRYFRKGQYIQIYNGKRTPDSIVSFMKNPPEKPKFVHKIDI